MSLLQAAFNFKLYIVQFHKRYLPYILGKVATSKIQWILHAPINYSTEHISMKPLSVKSKVNFGLLEAMNYGEVRQVNS